MMGEPSCPYCGAAYSHRPPRSETILWKCASWTNRAKGLGDQSLFCRTQQLEQRIDGLIEAVKVTAEWDEHGELCCAFDNEEFDEDNVCDCAHPKLHAAVRAAEAAKGKPAIRRGASGV